MRREQRADKDHGTAQTVAEAKTPPVLHNLANGEDIAAQAVAWPICVPDPEGTLRTPIKLFVAQRREIRKHITRHTHTTNSTHHATHNTTRHTQHATHNTQHTRHIIHKHATHNIQKDKHITQYTTNSSHTYQPSFNTPFALRTEADCEGEPTMCS